MDVHPYNIELQTVIFVTLMGSFANKNSFGVVVGVSKLPILVFK